MRTLRLQKEFKAEKTQKIFRGINRLVLVGNIVNLPEVKDEVFDCEVLRFELGMRERETDTLTQASRQVNYYYQVVCPPFLTERIAKLELTVGMLVYVEGRLKTKKIVANSGTFFSAELIAHGVHVLDKGETTALASDQNFAERFFKDQKNILEEQRQMYQVTEGNLYPPEAQSKTHY
jgi:Single-stranded DNA-binding protein